MRLWEIQSRSTISAYWVQSRQEEVGVATPISFSFPPPPISPSIMLVIPFVFSNHTKTLLIISFILLFMFLFVFPSFRLYFLLPRSFLHWITRLPPFRVTNIRRTLLKCVCVCVLVREGFLERLIIISLLVSSRWLSTVFCLHHIWASVWRKKKQKWLQTWKKRIFFR